MTDDDIDRIRDNMRERGIATRDIDGIVALARRGLRADAVDDDNLVQRMRTTAWGTIRPCLRRFAWRMETQLSCNDHKGGWENDSSESLLARLREEVEELVEALWGNDRGAIHKEAADVANFAMMISDVHEIRGEKQRRVNGRERETCGTCMHRVRYSDSHSTCSQRTGCVDEDGYCDAWRAKGGA